MGHAVAEAHAPAAAGGCRPTGSGVGVANACCCSRCRRRVGGEEGASATPCWGRDEPMKVGVVSEEEASDAAATARGRMAACEEEIAIRQQLSCRRDMAGCSAIIHLA